MFFFMRYSIGFSAPLWCHLVFTHPTAMDSNFGSDTIHGVTRPAWSGVALCKLQLSKCFVGGGRNFFFLKIEEHQENQIVVSNELLFSKLRKENKSWLVILGTSAF